MENLDISNPKESLGMNKKVKVLVVITFIVMIVVNVLANTLPINGVTAGEVSDYYANLFTPAGYTFSIWGLIYLLLALYTFYQLGIINKNDSISQELLNKVGILFSISSIANTLWIFAWHYNKIYLSMILMFIILLCLITIVNLIKKETLTTKEKLFVKVPFSVYFGWITVATIANITVWLVSLGWDAFSPSAVVWAVIVIILGAIIALLTILKNKDFVYGLVILWAYIGILVKHVSKTGFNSMYPSVITTVIICLVLLIVVNTFVIFKKAY